MGSENKMQDPTTFGQSEAPILCANGCGFFGTAATLNLCSKCYRDHQLKEQTIAAAVEKSISPPRSPSRSVVVEAKKAAVTEVEEKKAVEEENVRVGKNRCGNCRKKVGVLGFKCRCGMTFCGAHRYPEEHGCNFDFKGLGRQAIEKANPVVKADKDLYSIAVIKPSLSEDIQFFN
ncbi:Zinc finger A20 and AN1 domain-containing stress-associated protein 1-like protein [Drosera capensis]